MVIGLMGFGTIGVGVYDLAKQSSYFGAEDRGLGGAAPHGAR